MNLILLFVPILLGLLSSQICEMRNEKTKPVFQPPGWVFAVVWNIIYLLYGLFIVIGLYRKQDHTKLIILWSINLFLNIIWSPIFSCKRSLQRSKMSLWIIVFMILTLIMLMNLSIIEYKSFNMTMCLTPYLTWLFVALLLNVEVIKIDASKLTK